MLKKCVYLGSLLLVFLVNIDKSIQDDRWSNSTSGQDISVSGTAEFESSFSEKVSVDSPFYKPFDRLRLLSGPLAENLQQGNGNSVEEFRKLVKKVKGNDDDTFPFRHTREPLLGYINAIQHENSHNATETLKSTDSDKASGSIIVHHSGPKKASYIVLPNHTHKSGHLKTASENGNHLKSRSRRATNQLDGEQQVPVAVPLTGGETGVNSGQPTSNLMSDGLPGQNGGEQQAPVPGGEAGAKIDQPMSNPMNSRLPSQLGGEQQVPVPGGEAGAKSGQPMSNLMNGRLPSQFGGEQQVPVPGGEAGIKNGQPMSNLMSDRLPSQFGGEQQAPVPGGEAGVKSGQPISNLMNGRLPSQFGGGQQVPLPGGEAGVKSGQPMSNLMNGRLPSQFGGEQVPVPGMPGAEAGVKNGQPMFNLMNGRLPSQFGGGQQVPVPGGEAGVKSGQPMFNLMNPRLSSQFGGNQQVPVAGAGVKSGIPSGLSSPFGGERKPWVPKAGKASGQLMSNLMSGRPLHGSDEEELTPVSIHGTRYAGAATKEAAMHKIKNLRVPPKIGSETSSSRRKWVHRYAGQKQQAKKNSEKISQLQALQARMRAGGHGKTSVKKGKKGSPRRRLSKEQRQAIIKRMMARRRKGGSSKLQAFLAKRRKQAGKRG